MSLTICLLVASVEICSNSVYQDQARNYQDHVLQNVRHLFDTDCDPESIFHQSVYRGSYMSAHVLLNLLNELGKRDELRGLPNILSLFCNEFNKFNNTKARMLDSIYHMTLRFL